MQDRALTRAYVRPIFGYLYERKRGSRERHRHESYDVYGLDGIRQGAREAPSLAAGGSRRAEERIRDLEEQVTALRRSTPQARQLPYEADFAAADARE